MVVASEGEATGSITAGCLEEEVRELSRQVESEGESCLERYDLVADDDVWGLGLGCNGIIDVLLEPLDESYAPVLERYNRRRSLSRVVLLERDGASRFDSALFSPEEGWMESGDGFPADLRENIADTVVELLEKERSKTLEISLGESTYRVFVDSVVAPDEVVVLGSGHDVAPVVELANKNNFRTCSVRFRGGVDPADVVPHADRAVKTTPSELLEAHDFNEDSFVVVMTHRFVDDQAALEKLVTTEVPYLGLMGPGERFERILEDSSEETRERLLENRERVYTPIGLNLGGGSPYQIATSIVAEILAVRNGRTPGHLRDREEPIHARIEPF